MAVGRGLTKALSEGVVNREEIFVTSMLWGSDHHDPIGGLRQTLKSACFHFTAPSSMIQYCDTIDLNGTIVVKLQVGHKNQISSIL